ncbi:hypothetical protein E4U27_001324 [Claviceps purpurea]|nr:hypothetical protein E4U27_001324 [Claviceps purpurea]
MLCDPLEIDVHKDAQSIMLLSAPNRPATRDPTGQSSPHQIRPRGGVHNPSKIRSGPAGLREQTITTASKFQVGIDQIVAQAVFWRAQPFTLFEQEDMMNLIEAIKNAPRSWKPPSRRRISGDLLKGVDETTDISQTRIVNMSLITEGGALLVVVYG